MSTELKLNPGENVIKRSTEIGYGGGISRKNNELILTDQSIILINKNLLGKVKEVTRFPLTDIVISGNRAQVQLGQKDIVTPTLDVYFSSGMESFIFTWEDEIKDWINQINTLLTGQPEIYKADAWMDDLENMADSLFGAAKKVRKAFGIKSTESLSCKCPSCGASISGFEGETVSCPYCGNFITLGQDRPQ